MRFPTLKNITLNSSYTIHTDIIKSSLRSQYTAALQMLYNVIEITANDLWDSKDQVSRSWQVAYHTLYYYRLYMFQNLEKHILWNMHRDGAQNLHPNEGEEPMTPYTQQELLELTKLCIENVESDLQALDITAEESGFPWYKVSKLEHQMVNLRHLQHHVAQLQDRLRNHKNQGISWIRSAGHLRHLLSSNT